MVFERPNKKRRGYDIGKPRKSGKGRGEVERREEF